MNNIHHIIMLVVFSAIFTLLVAKAMSKTPEPLKIPATVKVIEHKYDNPADFAEDTTLSDAKRAYYDHLYNQTEE